MPFVVLSVRIVTVTNFNTYTTYLSIHTHTHIETNKLNSEYHIIRY